MSLKIVALVIAGLVAQSSAFVVKTLQADAIIVPGFTFTAEKNTEHDKLSLTTPEGHLFSYPTYLNYSAWEFSTAGAPQIKQNVSLPVLCATYIAEYSIGDFSGSGKVRAYFGNNTFGLTFLARGDVKTCTLETKVSSPRMNVFLNMRELDESSALQASPVLEEVQSTVAKAMVDAWAPLFTDLTVKALPGLVDTADLCKKILLANEKNFPEPDL